MKKYIFTIMLVTLATSCAMHPLGISDDTWNKMTPEQQAEAYKKQADIDAKQRAEELAYQREQEQEIANIKADPKYGQYIQCVMQNGQYEAFINDWDHTIRNFSFDAIRNKTTTSTLVSYQNNNEFLRSTDTIHISFNGAEIKLCKTENGFGDDCSTITATLPQYQRGIKYKLDSGIIKGTVQCNMIYKGRKHHSRNNGGNIVINF